MVTPAVVRHMVHPDASNDRPNLVEPLADLLPNTNTHPDDAYTDHNPIGRTFITEHDASAGWWCRLQRILAAVKEYEQMHGGGGQQQPAGGQCREVRGRRDGGGERQ